MRLTSRKWAGETCLEFIHGALIDMVYKMLTMIWASLVMPTLHQDAMRLEK